jgi:hypothetical protein
MTHFFRWFSRRRLVLLALRLVRRSFSEVGSPVVDGEVGSLSKGTATEQQYTPDSTLLGPASIEL